MKIRCKLNIGSAFFFLMMMFMTIACEKNETTQVKAKAPLRSYLVTARLDNKQTGADSPATGILKGSYSETTKVFKYMLTYENVTATEICIKKRVKGTSGSLVINLAEVEGVDPSSPISGEKKLTSLEERDLIKGIWFVSIGSSKYSPGEISGSVTLKRN